MKKSISVSLGGLVFNIEEVAYEMLNTYLESIRQRIPDAAEREEVLEDIESRIAEIFHGLVNDAKTVITESDIQEVIAIMGSPEAYSMDDSENTTGQAESGKAHQTDSGSTYRDTTQRRLFRDDDEGIIGGVAAGVSHYFGVSPTLIRAIFVILAIVGGSGILIYILLWLVVPQANTTADKLQMNGQHVNLGNIKEHLRKMKDKVSEKANSQEFRDKIKQTVDKGVKATAGIGNVVSKLVGGLFLLGGIFALLILVTVFFGETGLIPIVGAGQVENLATMIEILYPGDAQHTVIFICIILASVIPVISIVISGIKLLFDIRKVVKPMVVTGSVLWALACGILIITGIELGMNFKSENEIGYSVPVDDDSTDVLHVNVGQDDVFSDHIELSRVWNYSELIKVTDDKIFMGFPNLRLVRNRSSDAFEILVYKYSKGSSIRAAVDKAEAINYDVKILNGELILPANYSFPVEDKIRGQMVVVEIRVPPGKKVVFGNDIDRVCVNVEGENYYHPVENSYSNTVWSSGRDGMTCQGCDIVQRIDR